MEDDDVITFCQTDFKSSSFAAFEDMRKNGELCDLTIMVQSKEITAHRIVVAAGIPYFRSTFVRNKDEEITLGDINSTALESLIDFAYSGSIKISNENVNQILAASKRLRLDKVLEVCVDFVSKRIDVNNIWKVRFLAVSLDITYLIEISNCYILSNMEELAKSAEFLNLHQSDLTQILFKNELNATSDKVLFDAILDWVKVSPCERQAILPELMDQIRLVYIPIEYLSEKAASEEVIRNSAVCRDMIDEVKNYYFFPTKKSLFPNVKTNPRQFSGLYSMCPEGSCISISYCDFVNKMWHSVSRSAESGGSTGRAIYWAVAVDVKLYIFCDEQINIFNTKTLEWHVVPEKWNFDMDATAMAAIGNVVYGFGSSVKNFHQTIWCFDTENNKWDQKGRTKKERCYAAAAAGILKDTSCVYVTGGFTTLNAVEIYSPSTNQCTEVEPMLTSRSCHASVSMSGKIYVCGGLHAAGTSETYDPVVDKWTSISALNAKKKLFSLAVYNTKLYALGFDDNCSGEIEIYHPEINKWESGFAIPKGFIKLLLI